MRAVTMRPRIGLVTVASTRGETGGAERLFEGLHAALCARGVEAERIEVPSDESSFDAILDAYLNFYDLDLSRFQGVISTKAPSFAVRHRNQVCYLLHTLRVFYDRFDSTFPAASPVLSAQRAFVQQLDTAALRRASVRAIFTVGEEVRRRLYDFNGLRADVLHHPSTLALSPAEGAKHFLVSGRLHPWKRVDLAIEAARRMRRPVELVITGAGDAEGPLRELASGLPQVRFTGHVSDDALAGLYRDALAVIFCPVGEDFGLSAVEALNAGKPVVTCADSGEPARLVRHGLTGFVCLPDPQAIAERLDWLAEHPEAAREMRDRCVETVASISWDTVCARLLSALGCAPALG